MKLPFWMKLDGPYQDPTGEWYYTVRVPWYGWPFLIAISLWDMLKGYASGSR